MPGRGISDNTHHEMLLYLEVGPQVWEVGAVLVANGTEGCGGLRRDGVDVLREQVQSHLALLAAGSVPLQCLALEALSLLLGLGAGELLGGGG